MTEFPPITPRLNPDREAKPTDKTSEIIWVALDTAQNLLREYAVRAVLQSMREVAEEQGVTWDSDEGLFASVADVEGAPKNHLDLAPDMPLHLNASLSLVFSELLAVAEQEAKEGMSLAWEEGGDA